MKACPGRAEQRLAERGGYRRCAAREAGSGWGWPPQGLRTPGPGERGLPEARPGSASTTRAAPPPLRPQPAPPGTADGAQRRRERPRRGWLRARCSPRLSAPGPAPPGPAASAALDDAAAAPGSSGGKLGALQVRARPLWRGKLGPEFAGGAWGRGGWRCPRAPLPAGRRMGRPRPGQRCGGSGLRRPQGWRAAGPEDARLLRRSPNFEAPGAWERPAALAGLWRRIRQGAGEEELRQEPSGLPRGPAHVDCRGGDVGAAGGWAWGTAGAEAPQGPGRALLGRDGPAVSSLGLDSPSGRSPGWRDRPEAVTARTLRPGRPLLLTSRQSVSVGPWGWVRGPS